MFAAKIRHTVRFFAFTALGLCALHAHAAQVQYLAYPNQYLAAVYTAIQGAKQEVLLNYYEVDPCSTSTKVLVKILSDAKKNTPNLRINFIADAFPFGQSPILPSASASAFARFVRSQNMDLKLYNPPDLLADGNHRSHAKYVVVDGTTANGILITGSSNMADAYFSMKDNGLNYINRDVLVSDAKAAGTARDHFKKMWNGPATGSSDSLLDSMYGNFQQCLKWTAREDALLNELKSNAVPTLTAMPVYQCPNVKFAADPYMISDKPTKWILLDFLNNKQNSKLLIENYIYAPTGLVSQALNGARAKVPTLIYTNYYQNSGEVFENQQNEAIRRDSRGKLKILALPTIDYASQHWSQSANRMYFQNHSKMMVSNDQNILISSFNLDNRSSNINVESAIVFYNCPELAKDAQTITAELLKSLNPEQQSAVQDRSHGDGIHIDSNLFTEIRDLIGGDLY